MDLAQIKAKLPCKAHSTVGKKDEKSLKNQNYFTNVDGVKLVVTNGIPKRLLVGIR